MSHSNENAPPPPTRRPRRVAFVITELDPGGAERQLVRLATNLDRHLFEPEVVCLSSPGVLVEPLRAAGVPVTCLDARGPRDLGVIRRLRSHLKRSRPDLVQTFLFHANVAGRIAARLAGVPVVVSGLRVAEPRRWHLRLDRLTDRLVDRHVCVSRAVADHSARVAGLPVSKLVVVPNAVDAEVFANAAPADLTEFGFPPKATVVLFVGRLDEQKDPVRLLEAFRLLAPEFGDARLLFVGAGPLDSELRARAADLDGRVAFAGRRDDVPALLKASACLALTSRWEGMPNVVLEALAAGTPVVATDVEGVRELLGDDDLFGEIVQDVRPAAFAFALARRLKKFAADRYTGLAAQTFAVEAHTTNGVVAAYQSLYADLLSRTGR